MFFCKTVAFFALHGDVGLILVIVVHLLRITNLDKNVSLTDRKSLKLVEADVNEVEE